MYEDNTVKRWLSLLLLGFLTISQGQAAVAYSAEQERIYLVQLINQLNAMLPIIRMAEKSQPKNQRVNFRYYAWKDAGGNKHNGLLEDVQAIKTGIEEKLNAITIEPRAIAPMGGDYVDSH